jgi:hypothetical protein
MLEEVGLIPISQDVSQLTSRPSVRNDSMASSLERRRTQTRMKQKTISNLQFKKRSRR